MSVSEECLQIEVFQHRSLGRGKGELRKTCGNSSETALRRAKRRGEQRRGEERDGGGEGL